MTGPESPPGVFQLVALVLVGAGRGRRNGFHIEDRRAEAFLLAQLATFFVG